MPKTRKIIDHLYDSSDDNASSESEEQGSARPTAAGWRDGCHRHEDARRGDTAVADAEAFCRKHAFPRNVQKAIVRYVRDKERPITLLTQQLADAERSYGVRYVGLINKSLGIEDDLDADAVLRAACACASSVQQVPKSACKRARHGEGEESDEELDTACVPASHRSCLKSMRQFSSASQFNRLMATALVRMGFSWNDLRKGVNDADGKVVHNGLVCKVIIWQWINILCGLKSHSQKGGPKLDELKDPDAYEMVKDNLLKNICTVMRNVKNGNDSVPMKKYDLEELPEEDTPKDQLRRTNDFLDWLLSLYNSELQEGSSLQNALPSSKADKSLPLSKVPPTPRSLQGNSEKKHPASEAPRLTHSDSIKKRPPSEPLRTPQGHSGQKRSCRDSLPPADGDGGSMRSSTKDVPPPPPDGDRVNMRRSSKEVPPPPPDGDSGNMRFSTKDIPPPPPDGDGSSMRFSTKDVPPPPPHGDGSSMRLSSKEVPLPPPDGDGGIMRFSTKDAPPPRLDNDGSKMRFSSKDVPAPPRDGDGGNMPPFSMVGMEEEGKRAPSGRIRKIKHDENFEYGSKLQQPSPAKQSTASQKQTAKTTKKPSGESVLNDLVKDPAAYGAVAKFTAPKAQKKGSGKAAKERSAKVAVKHNSRSKLQSATHISSEAEDDVQEEEDNRGLDGGDDIYEPKARMPRAAPKTPNRKGAGKVAKVAVKHNGRSKVQSATRSTSEAEDDVQEEDDRGVDGGDDIYEPKARLPRAAPKTPNRKGAGKVAKAAVKHNGRSKVQSATPSTSEAEDDVQEEDDRGVDGGDDIYEPKARLPRAAPKKKGASKAAKQRSAKAEVKGQHKMQSAKPSISEAEEEEQDMDEKDEDVAMEDECNLEVKKKREPLKSIQPYSGTQPHDENDGGVKSRKRLGMAGPRI